MLICVRLFAFTTQPERREAETDGERDEEGRLTGEPTRKDRKQMEWKEKQDP